jgi:hypothetical protein
VLHESLDAQSSTKEQRVAGGFKINRQGIQRMAREIEREFAKHPVRVPIEADPSGLTWAPAVTVNNYHGPVVTVTGDHAQLAWSNDTVNQTQDRVEQIAPGYEDLARTLTDLLANLTVLGLGDDEADARDNTEAVLSEIVKETPDPGVVKRGLTMIKGLLAPIATGVRLAVTAESTEAAQHVIQALGNNLPF